MSFIDAFVNHAKEMPGRIALSDTLRSWRYGELATLACDLANDLNWCAPDSGTVAIVMGKSPEMVIAILGVLLSGRCYVPIDPTIPTECRQRILMDSNATVLLCRAEDAAASVWPGQPASLCRLRVSAELPRQTGLESLVKPVLPHHKSNNLAAILYTSGSTSTPKGVMLGWGAFDKFTTWAARYFDLGADDRVASHAPFGFDISILDLFATFLVGGHVVLVPEEHLINGRYLVQFLEREKITFWQSVPAPLIALVSAELDGDLGFPDLRHVISTGEAISAAVVGRLGRMAPNMMFHNIYGCTETNDSFIFTSSTRKLCLDAPIPVGRAIEYIDYKIVDGQDRPVPLGVPGELLVASPVAFEGYTDRRLTEKACVDLDGKRYFRTRDRVFQGRDEVVHFLCRTDTTVKIRGYRIDLAEVEACLLRVKIAKEVAVVSVLHPVKGKCLVGVLSIQLGDSSSISPIGLKQHCAQMLPRQAIPDWFEIQTTALPHNKNGKIDRHNLARIIQEKINHQYQDRKDKKCRHFMK